MSYKAVLFPAVQYRSVPDGKTAVCTTIIPGCFLLNNIPYNGIYAEYFYLCTEVFHSMGRPRQAGLFVSLMPDGYALSGWPGERLAVTV